MPSWSLSQGQPHLITYSPSFTEEPSRIREVKSQPGVHSASQALPGFGSGCVTFLLHLPLLLRTLPEGISTDFQVQVVLWLLNRQLCAFIHAQVYRTFVEYILYTSLWASLGHWTSQRG